MKLTKYFNTALALATITTAVSAWAGDPFDPRPELDLDPPDLRNWANYHVGQIVHWEGSGTRDAWGGSAGGRASFRV